MVLFLDVDVPEEEVIFLKYLVENTRGKFQRHDFKVENGHVTEISYMSKLLGDIKGALPDSLSNLRHLRSLDFMINKITALPSSVRCLESLEELRLNRNELTWFPDDLGHLPKLRFIGLGYNNISSFPESICSLTNLSYLEISSNGLTALPTSIGNLKSLAVLDITGNEITELPNMISQLRSLREVRLPYSLQATLPPFLEDWINELKKKGCRVDFF